MKESVMNRSGFDIDLCAILHKMGLGEQQWRQEEELGGCYESSRQLLMVA